MLRRIAILVSDGFTDSALSVALDVFRAANSLRVRAGGTPIFRVVVATAHGGPVRAGSGMVVEPTALAAKEARRADVVLVTSPWVETAAEMDAALEREDVRALVRVIARAHARGAIVGSACGGSFLLADAGLLDGREATTAWWLGPHLQRRRPAAIVRADSSLVIDGRVLSAGAVFAQADLTLHLVTQFGGPALAQHCAKVLLLDTHPSQARYMAVRSLSANDKTVRRAETWVRAHLADDFAIATLARHVGASPRTLARRLDEAVGVSPIAFVQRLRIEAAVQMLETTRLSLQEISEKVGYSDPNTLRRLIRRETGSTPREVRRRDDEFRERAAPGRLHHGA